MKEKKLLFSVTAADCDWTDFTASGPGGQHRNRVKTAIRVVHRASGAVGVATDNKSQLANRQNAFARMAKTKEFQLWAKMESSKLITGKSINDVVDDLMQAKNIKYEVKDEDTGQWKESSFESS